jgi:hypothetical protein
MNNNHGRDGNLCDMCLNEFAWCVSHPVFGIDRDPALAYHKDADMVVECEEFLGNLPGKDKP